MTVPRRLVVTPSVDPANSENLVSLAAAFAAMGADYLVVCNSRALERSLEARGNVPFRWSGGNNGFGWAVTRGVEQADDADWQWLVLVNDDAVVDSAAFADALPQGDGSALEIHYYDPEPVRRVPDSRAVLANLSLFANVAAKLRRRDSAPVTAAQMPVGTYKSFSVVAISRRLWDEVGGFDARLPFTYEDADFAARAWRLGATATAHLDSGVDHQRSVSSTRKVAFVLPVSAWSAYQYLMTLGSPAWAARLACMAALAARVTAIGFAKADKRAHLEGIGRSLAALALAREPRLPNRWDDQ